MKMTSLGLHRLFCVSPIFIKTGLAATLVLASSLSVAAEVEYTANAPIIDGQLNDSAWQQVEWKPLNHLIVGQKATAEDFSGRYALRWDEDYLYLAAIIQDDIMVDFRPDPRDAYWDDDALEIFLDEDKSGGPHQFDHNAFAHHIAIDNQSADIGPNHPDGSLNVVLLTDHVHSVWKRNDTAPFEAVWEVRIEIHDDSFSLLKPENKSRVSLTKDKVMGFMLAYCDSDTSGSRESFYGSHDIKAVNGDKNLGYKDASVFGEITLVKSK